MNNLIIFNIFHNYFVEGKWKVLYLKYKTLGITLTNFSTALSLLADNTF